MKKLIDNVAANGRWLMMFSLYMADDATDTTLYSSRIDGLLDPFWRQS